MPQVGYDMVYCDDISCYDVLGSRPCLIMFLFYQTVNQGQATPALTRNANTILGEKQTPENETEWM